ncbi:hypothetical protein D3OALGA1CA_2109 [Olavius algarvensis associated proteobacterium Delta 3]|nr:hypothetical protein D3OALGA1CA_2109 [Olavius algarvensis associated proteobacterium Delta 3]CAB5121292.1 hypothetical protein D3OALGB2SA_3003 [Olavius algarvensis associated proteobacterium Delta 3]
MICETIRKGMECPFMTANGCGYNGGKCHMVVEQCEGCGKTSEFNTGWYCTACPDPAIKWKNGTCNLASHVKAATASNAQKINPLKASKRGSR